MICLNLTKENFPPKNPDMKLIILGSGTGTPLCYRASPSAALLLNGNYFLFDIGPGTLRQMARVSLSHERINRIFITHLHPDHTADLIHFIFATRNPSVIRNRAPFGITGPEGIKKFISMLQDAYYTSLNLPPHIMQIEELDSKRTLERDYQFIRIKTCPTSHTTDSIAYRVECPSGESFVYSGDTGFSEDIIRLAKGVDVLILEASFPDGTEVEGHLTPSQAGFIASSAGVKRLVLTHFYPECLATDIASQCRKSYDGELTLGSDLLNISI